MDQSTSSSSQSSSAHVPSYEYSMDHKRRGKLIIFNNCFYEGTMRKGARKDVLALRACFRKHGFEVTVQNDRKKKEIKAILKALSNEDHSDADCLAICVMAHGSEKSIRAKDKEYDSDLIFQFLTPDKCPTLAQKPKLIFFQLCLGDNPMSSFLLPNPLIWPDFFTAYSRFHDYKSFGNSPGSSFMQMVAKKMTESGSRLSIHEIFMEINYDLSQRNKASDPKEEDLIVLTCYTLTKGLVLKPKTE